MKITGGYYKKEDIAEFVEKSSPEYSYKFTTINFSEEAGWVNIALKKNDKEIHIKYSSVMTDTADLFQFLADVVDLNEDVALILDNEGSNPLLYAKKINGEIIRFLFASVYNLYKSFCNDEIDDYILLDYKIEFDILINKKLLLEEFYKILSSYITDYNYNDADRYGVEFDIQKGKKYFNTIKSYLKK